MVRASTVETSLNLAFILFNLAYNKTGEILFYLVKTLNVQYNFYDSVYIHSDKIKSIVSLFNFDVIMKSRYQSILLILK